MKEEHEYVMLIKKPKCHYTCYDCKVGIVLKRFDGEFYFHYPNDFRQHCLAIKESDVKSISTKLAEKILMSEEI